MSKRLRYVLHQAYISYINGEPFAVDVFSELIDSGLEPEVVYQAFVEGMKPLDFLAEYNDHSNLFNDNKNNFGGRLNNG